MRLVKDHSPGAYAVRVQCVKCNRVVLLSDAYADADGRAFMDYYCDDCVFDHDAPMQAPVPGCNREGCTRCA